MSDKAEKPKKSKSKPKKDEKGVLAALPSTRAERIGTRRVSAPGASAKPAGAKPAAAKAPAAKRPTAAKSSTAAAKKPARKRARKAAAPRATATRRRAAAPRTFEPTQAAETAAGAADERAAGAVPLATPQSEPRPRAVRPGAPGMGTSGERDQPSPERGRPSGVELVTTAVQAAGELTQIGLTIGGKIIKRAVNRLPKP